MKEHFSKLPSVDRILQVIKEEQNQIDNSYIKIIITRILDTIKKNPQHYKLNKRNRQQLQDIIIKEIRKQVQILLSPAIRRVINATGVVLHTGLGRAPLGAKDLKDTQELAYYVNLEINLKNGKRGERLDHVVPHLRLITGADDAVVVNNNAAAVLLTLHTLARKKEVIISRGELVEIGGSFRMPEVMQNSQAKMIEVGATNKTHLHDYANAISAKTAAIMLVHPSNFQISGFTYKPDLREIVDLAHKHQIPVIYDLGSGALVDMQNYCLDHEPEVSEIIAAGVDLVTFSADKLLGGPQGGIIVGTHPLLQRIRKNHLLRALRCDKITLSLLNLTLRKYLEPNKLKEKNLALNLFSRPIGVLKEISEKILAGLNKKSSVTIRLVDADGKVGSGAFPLFKIPSIALELERERWSANQITSYMRSFDIPIIGTIEKNCFRLNLLTVFEQDIKPIINAINRLK